MPSQSNSRSNSSTRGSQDQAAPDIVQELYDLIDEYLAAEEIVDMHLELDQDRRVAREAEIQQHRAFLALSVPGPPQSSSIHRRPVGAPPRQAVSPSTSRSSQQSTQVSQYGVVVGSDFESYRGYWRNDLVMSEPTNPIAHSRHLSDIARDAPIPLEFDPALQAPMLQSELESDHAEDAPIPMTELETERTHEASSLVTLKYRRHGVLRDLVRFPLESQNLAQLDRIHAQEGRARSLPAGQPIPYTGIDPNRPYSRPRRNPALDVTSRHPFRSSTAANLNTSQFRNPRNSMVVTTLHYVHDSVPEQVRDLVVTEYQAPYHRVANLMRRAWHGFSR